MLKPVVNSESYNSLIKTLRGQSVAECRFPQSSEINEIIAVYPQVSCVSCEVSSGRVNYSGKLVLTLVYTDEEGKLCRMQKGAEFSHHADDDCLAQAQNGVCRMICEKTTVKRDGSSFVVATIVTAEIEIYARAERSYLAAAEGAYLNLKRVPLSSRITFGGESEVEDDFDADSVVDILIPSAKAVVLSSVCGTGEVNVSGEIYLSLFAMRQQTPVCLERVIPFKCAIPCDDASAGIAAQACAEISDLNVTATVNEERGKCEINFVCNLSVNGNFTAVREEEIADDAFSCDNEVTLSYAEEQTERCVDVKVYTERVSGMAASKSRLGYDCKFFAAALPEAECSFIESSGAVEGTVLAVLVYEQNGEIKGTEVTLPFSAVLNGVAENGQNVCISVAASGVSVRLKAEGEAEVEALLKISATVTEKSGCRYVCEIAEGEAKVKEDCALSVFLPAAGDGLWEISKKLDKNPSDVIACNPELSFPLTGKERILVYRSKN